MSTNTIVIDFIARWNGWMSARWKAVIIVLFGWAIIAMAVNQHQANTIKDLQRRVDQLEMQCKP